MGRVWAFVWNRQPYSDWHSVLTFKMRLKKKLGFTGMNAEFSANKGIFVDTLILMHAVWLILGPAGLYG